MVNYKEVLSQSNKPGVSKKQINPKEFPSSNDCDIVIVKQFWCMRSSKVFVAVLVRTEQLMNFNNKVVLVKYF